MREEVSDKRAATAFAHLFSFFIMYYSLSFISWNNLKIQMVSIKYS